MFICVPELPLCFCIMMLIAHGKSAGQVRNHKHTHMHLCRFQVRATLANTKTHKHKHTHSHIHAHVLVHGFTCTCITKHAYKHNCTHTHTHTLTHTHIHTPLHTQLFVAGLITCNFIVNICEAHFNGYDGNVFNQFNVFFTAVFTVSDQRIMCHRGHQSHHLFQRMKNRSCDAM
jgi:hypothetical protein